MVDFRDLIIGRIAKARLAGWRLHFDPGDLAVGTSAKSEDFPVRVRIHDVDLVADLGPVDVRAFENNYSRVEAFRAKGRRFTPTSAERETR
jgi:hypothetical protein